MRTLFSGLFIIAVILIVDVPPTRSSVAQRNVRPDKVCRVIAEDGTTTKIHSPSGEAITSADLPEYAPDEVIFKLIGFETQHDIKPLQAQQNIQRRLQQVAQRHRFINTAAVFKNSTSKQLRQIHRAHLPAGVSVTNAVKRLEDDPDIEWAEPQYYRYTQTTVPNDPCYYSQKHLSTIKAPNAWDITTGDPNVVIAIIDTGVDYEHPDLAANIWINPGEDHEPFGVVGPEDFNRVDDDGNAYVDDILGWDFVSVNPDDVYPGEDPEPPDNDPIDFHGHGTHVAGIAGGLGTILREYWMDIQGSSVSNLTGNSNYPDNPTGSSEPTLFEAPTTWADYYGTRMQGFIHPPTNGDYIFWIASDDGSELWLSTDTNPANKSMIASVSTWTNSRDWTQYASQ